MIYQTKRFSKGKETAEQKQDRKSAVANIISTGAMAGSSLGMATVLKKNFKIDDKARKIANKTRNQNIQILDVLMDTQKALKKGVRPRNQKEADMLNYYIKKSEHYLDVNKRGRDRAFKIAQKMKDRNLNKKGLKGAVIGAAVSAPLAYATNRAMKKHNS